MSGENAGGKRTEKAANSNKYDSYTSYRSFNRTSTAPSFASSDHSFSFPPTQRRHHVPPVNKHPRAQPPIRSPRPHRRDLRYTPPTRVPGSTHFFKKITTRSALGLISLRNRKSP